MATILEGQPVLYARILPEFLSSEIPEETKATCSSCAMCAATCQSPLDSAADDAGFFRTSTKCCTYHPNLPNYLVGAILADTSEGGAEGRRRIEAKIASRIGVTPYGISAPGKFALLYQNTREFFGRSSSMRCPYYIEESGGLCSIWKFREAVCSTYFCKHVAGADGRKFWMTLKGYLALVETQLMRYATLQEYPEYVVSEKHPAEPPARKLTAEELDDKGPSAKSYESLWGSWQGMEVEYYQECHRIVSRLDKVELESILGLDGKITLEILKKRHQNAVFPTLPATLRLNPDLSTKWLGDGSLAVGAYSELDALQLPGEAFALLSEFKGTEPVTSVRERLRRERQTDFDDDLLVTLYQHRVLTEAEAR